MTAESAQTLTNPHSRNDTPPPWGDACWIGKPETEAAQATPVGRGEDRPQDTMTLKPLTYLRREFDLKQADIVSARLNVTALGLYQIFVNGHRVGDHVLAPGFTDYNARVHVQHFAVRDVLVAGRNVIAAVIADGWYCGFVGFDRGRQGRLWGEVPRLLARLEITLDEDTVIVETDAQWRRSTGRFVYADLQMGEMQDGRTEPVGWTASDFDDSTWSPVHADAVDMNGPAFTYSAAPPITVTETLLPQLVRPMGGKRWVVDFGQNLVGVVRLRIDGGTPGQRVHLRHAEALTPDGNLYTDNLRSALAHDIYVCAGGSEEFRPEFTAHGFRYAEIAGYPGTLHPADVNALVLHTDVARIGTFSCSSPELSQLNENVDWTIRGNLLDVPTDCPQRDERLGWLGDAQLIMTSAVYLRDLGGVLAKWTQDIRDAQTPSGAFPDVAPRAGLEQDGAPGWADAGAIVPWIAFLSYGSTDELARNYESMSRWVDCLVANSPGLIRTRGLGRNYGDWLDFGTATPRYLLGTAYFAYSVEVVAHAAQALGHTADAARLSALWADVRAAFIAEFVDDEGRVDGDTQTGYAMALHLDLIPAELRERAADNLVAAIDRVGHLTTGIHGSRFLCPALSDAGRSARAYDLLFADKSPSWLHMVANGATTIWERWDGWTTEYGFHNPRMNSFNHYALGSVAEWMHRYVAGITPMRDGPGWRHCLVRPHPDPRLSWVAASHQTTTGEFSVRWDYEAPQFELSVRVPPHARATIAMPGQEETTEIGPGSHNFRTELAQNWMAAPALSPDRLHHTRA
ncbi:MAG TPA: family 78 glycoside hydrolase catalytic domain [Acidothermaceae bacterium]